MSTELQQRLLHAVREIEDPHLHRPLGDAVEAVALAGQRAAVRIRLGYPASGWRERLEAAVRARLADSGIDEVAVDIDWRIVEHAVQEGLTPLPGVRNIIAVASGKGGVGKSTVATNLALALQAEGARVGVLDADVYGPSQPRLLGLKGRPEATADRRIMPLEAFGIQAMSIGVLVAEDQAMIWRGPMASQALTQLVESTLWDRLDYLVLDLPPGTGDIQLTLAQRIPVAGAVLVTTPQTLALDDVRRASAMFTKVKVPTLGVIENMSTYVCPNCGHEDAVFGSGGGERIAAECALALLGRIPLDRTIASGADRGAPVVVADPGHPASQRFREIARVVAARLAAQPLNTRIPMPKVRISD
ncbi:MAG: iron-sulfur cluster carrier protein ApbC [Wenzhouxiangellaceae bacterium]